MSKMDVNNKAGFTTVNNNPPSTSAVDCVPSSPVMRTSSGDQSASAAVFNRRSDFADYRGGSGGSGTGSTVSAGISTSFRSPKLECRGAGGGGASAKKAQKTSHQTSVMSSTAGKRRQKMGDVSASASTSHSQASDSVCRLSRAFVVVSC